LEYYPQSADFHDDLGAALARQGRIEEAKAEFDRALQFDPNLADAHHNLGRLLAGTGQLDEAVPHFEKAIAINPSFAEAHTALGCVWVEEGKVSQAIPQLQKALALQPSLVEAHDCLGEALYISQARTQEALAHWREALRLDPNYAPAMNEAAYALAASPEAADRNGAEAVRLAQRAVQLTGSQDPDYLDTLAAAYAEAGRFPDAIAAAHKALDIATQQQRGQLVEALNARIKLYEAQQPYRDPVKAGP
jgi:tetratricopeptide (TPR) repeat protein